MKLGESIAAVPLFVLGREGPEQKDSTALLGAGKCLLIAVPGAFTPTCHDQMPGYVSAFSHLQQKGFQHVYCLAVNDPFVLASWSKALQAEGKITMLADSDAAFTRAMEMGCDLSAAGLGMRSKRYVAVIEDGTVQKLYDDDGPGLDKTKAEKVLADL